MTAAETEFHRIAWRLPATPTERVSDPEEEYYFERIKSVKSVDDLLSDDRIYNFATTAFGLTEVRDARALMRRVLSEGASGGNAFALELADQRLRDFAETFDFRTHGIRTTQREAVRRGVVERYRRLVLESEIGRRDEGARLALAFERKISGIRSIYGLLGDKELYEVTRIALGLPVVTMHDEADRQAASISEQIDLKDFEEPGHLAEFLRGFMLKWEGLARGRPFPHNDALSSVSTVHVLGGDVLLNVQAMKTGSM